MRYSSVVLVLIGSVLFSAADVRAQANSSLLTQVQAANILSDLLTFTSDRAEARVKAMQQFLVEIGKDQAYAQAKPAVKRNTAMDFTHVFQGAVDFVKQGGAKYADPGLDALNQDQMLQELTTLQTYNINEYLQLNQQREAADSMAIFLDSIGQFEAYLKWARAKQPNVPAQPDAPAKTPEELAARIEKSIGTMHDVMWKKAQARGMTQADFDARWPKWVAQYREQVAQKVDGMNSLAANLGKSQLAGSAPPPVPQDQQSPQSAAPLQSAGAIWQAGAPVAPSIVHQLPPTVQSTYTTTYYQNQSNELWNEWGDQYGDCHH